MSFYAVMTSKEFNVENFRKAMTLDKDTMFVFGENSRAQTMKPDSLEVYNLEDAIEMVKEHFEAQLEGFGLKIAEAQAIDKGELENKRIYELEVRVKKVCSNLLESTDKMQFYNRLDEICALKKQIFTDRNDEIANIRKVIGHYKFKIREMQNK
jgi:Ethanolamine utilization protein EutJ (predicted chaperonin)